MVRVNFQYRGVLLIWIIVGQGPNALTVGAGGCCSDIFSLICHFYLFPPSGGGRVVQRCRVNFQCRGVLQFGFAVGAGWGCLDNFYSHLSFLSSFSLSLGDSPIQTEILSQRAVKPKTTNQPNFPPSIWETARYRLKYYLKGPLSPEQPYNQQTCYMFNDCKIVLANL